MTATNLHAALEKNAYLKLRRVAVERGCWRGRVPSIGTARRLQALAAIGWCWSTLAEIAGVNESVIRDAARAKYPTVNPATADRVSGLYDRLSMTPGPSTRAVTWAAKNGFAPPLAWDDDEIDNPDAQPHDGLEHGTRKGYDQHRHRGEKACRACLDAAAANRRAREAA